MEIQQNLILNPLIWEKLFILVYQGKNIFLNLCYQQSKKRIINILAS